jgi:hypothetical protein
MNREYRRDWTSRSRQGSDELFRDDWTRVTQTLLELEVEYADMRDAYRYRIKIVCTMTIRQEGLCAKLRGL